MNRKNYPPSLTRQDLIWIVVVVGLIGLITILFLAG